MAKSWNGAEKGIFEKVLETGKLFPKWKKVEEDLSNLNNGIQLEDLWKKVKEKAGKVKEKTEKVMESIKMKKVFKESVLKLRENFKLPGFGVGDVYTINYWKGNTIKLTTHGLDMRLVSEDGWVTHHVLGENKSGSWKGLTGWHVGGGRIWAHMGTFDDKKFAKDLNKFIKNADQCKITKKTNKNKKLSVGNFDDIHKFIPMIKGKNEWNETAES